MMNLVVVLILLINYYNCITTAAQEDDWVGSYVDLVYGGQLNVCVSEVDGTYYGQGLYSELGYMRGVINGTSWTGNFYVAGIEAIRGNFSMQLENDGDAISGTYYQSPVGSISYNVNNTRISSSTPSDIECFKADVSMLTATADYDFTGAWREEGVPDDYPWYISSIIECVIE